MKNLYILFSFLLFTLPNFLFSQNESDSSKVNYIETTKPIEPIKPVEEEKVYQHYLLDSNSTNTIIFKPVIGIGRGILTYMGDINDNYNDNLFVGRAATQVIVSRNIKTYLKANFSLTYGVLTGNEHYTAEYKNLNFQTEIINIGVNLSYNFQNLIKKSQRIYPFISLGIETFQFNSKADLYDAYGNKYNYWSDGTIRNIDESKAQEEPSIIINRDFKYETDLREMNLDGLGKYNMSAYSLPVDIGLDLTITSQISMRLGNTFHFTFSDNIDNVSNSSTGDRKRNSKNDYYNLTYVSLHFDLLSPSDKSKRKKHYAGFDFTSITEEDEDSDGVVDFWDNCPFTPTGVIVDKKGCPVDTDGDGIPDFEDKEENKTKQYINGEGVGMTEDELIALVNQDGVTNDSIFIYYPSMMNPVKSFKTSFFFIPAKFVKLDTNNDEFVSLDEFMKAVDAFFDFSPDYSIDFIYELSDFFFDQEKE